MKRWIACMLCAALLLGTAAALAEEEAWKCPSCGEMSDGNFCGYCHTPRPQDADAEAVCAACGAVYAAGQGYLFCKNCGAPLTEQTASLAEKKDTLAVGDIVAFGYYEQDGYPLNGPEPIDWQVLDVQGSRALLISRYALDAKQHDEQGYNLGTYNAVWETSAIRAWLNGEFMATAFSEGERAAVLTTTVDNGKEQGDSQYESAGGNDTEDRLFLLSFAEAGAYFASDEARRCVPTPFAVKRCATSQYNYAVDGQQTTVWWLRSSGGYPYTAYMLVVDTSGSLRYYDTVAAYDGVRPAMWVDLSAVTAP